MAFKGVEKLVEELGLSAQLEATGRTAADLRLKLGTGAVVGQIEDLPSKAKVELALADVAVAGSCG